MIIYEPHNGHITEYKRANVHTNEQSKSLPQTKVHSSAIERPNGVVREKDERNVPLFPIFFPATPRRKRMETHGTVQQVGLGVTVQKHVLHSAVIMLRSSVEI